jgi:hypothetical protein
VFLQCSPVRAAPAVHDRHLQASTDSCTTCVLELQGARGVVARGVVAVQVRAARGKVASKQGTSGWIGDAGGVAASALHRIWHGHAPNKGVCTYSHHNRLAGPRSLCCGQPELARPGSAAAKPSQRAPCRTTPPPAARPPRRHVTEDEELRATWLRRGRSGSRGVLGREMAVCFHGQAEHGWGATAQRLQAIGTGGISFRRPPGTALATDPGAT